MWDIRACRGCLAVNCKLEKLSNAFKRIFGSVTGLEIKDTDGFPKYFCTECHAQIKKCVAFRRKARRAFFVLQEIATVRKEVSYKDIITVDRTKTNLESNLGYWKTTNRGFYSIEALDQDDVENEVESNDKCMVHKTYEPKFKKLSTCQVINIKPDSSYYIKKKENNTKEDIQENLEEPIVAEEVILENDIDNKPESPETPEQFEPSNIDINDVFKDLKEDSLSENEEFEEEPVKNKERIRKKVELPNPMLGILSTHQLYQCGKALVNSKIEFQEIIQQSNNFAIRMLREPYLSSSYKCFICLEVYKNIEDLTTHAGLHNDWSVGSHKCNICKNKFPKAEELMIHQAANHWYKYTCKICGISEYTLLDILKHYSIHDKENEDDEVYLGFLTVDDLKEYFNLELLPRDELHKSIENYTGDRNKYSCHDCNIGFRNYNSIVLHRKKHDRNSNKKYCYQCDVCSQWFVNTESITKHMQNWHTYQFECKTCSTIVYNSTQASHHYRSHQRIKKQNFIEIKDSKKWNCSECERTFTSDKGLMCHMRIVHNKQMWKEQCNVCGLPFMKPFKLYIHQLQFHKYISLNHPMIGSEQFLCKKCDIYFVNEKAYQYHLLALEHEEAKDVPFACVPCKKLFENDEELSKHTTSCEKYPKKCSYCEAVLVNLLEYKSHYARVHPDLQYKHTSGFLCELCGKSVQKQMLKVHMQKHFERNTFPCRYCSLECPTATHLLVHVVSMHTRRPYHCGICRKRLKYRAACRDHILKVHAPIKPYECGFCNKYFSDIKLFSQHSIIIHGVEVNKTPVKKFKGKLYLYPNMKIDVSLVDEYLLKTKIEAELCDYLDEKSKPVEDIENYIVRNEGDLQSFLKWKIKKRKVRNVKVLNAKKQIIEDVTDSVISKENKLEKENEVIEDNIEKMELEIDDSLIDTHGQMDVVLENTSQDIQVDETELEIIEKNGEQFVTLNGILYKIENSEEQ